MLTIFSEAILDFFNKYTTLSLFLELIYFSNINKNPLRVLDGYNFEKKF